MDLVSCYERISRIKWRRQLGLISVIIVVGDMDMKVGRTPPVEVRRILRQEVNFGCPVCGSPFLTWHYFDPPWEERHHHNLNGMVALCFQHHKEADAGAYTKGQIQSLKSNPYLSKPHPRAKFNWLREQILLEVGSNYYMSPNHILRVAKHDLVWIDRDGFGLNAISLDLRGANGDPILRMKANDWVLPGQVDDIICPASANSLAISVADQSIRLQLRFRSVTEARLRERIVKRCSEFIWEPIRALITGFPVALCTIDGYFVWPITFRLTPAGTTVLHKNVRISCCFKAGGGLTVHEDGGMSF
jgi:hypothetical protein